MAPPSDAPGPLDGSAWRRVLDALPPLAGVKVVDVGCGGGEQAAELAARGARVLGLDINGDLIREARGRDLPGAVFREVDLRLPLELEEDFDGLWSSYAAAYFPDLAAALHRWTHRLRPGGFAALVEIADLFGHEPLGEGARAMLAAYAEDAIAAGRYDFHMGRKLAAHLEHAGFTVTKAWTLPDAALSFDGPAPREVLETWRERLDRMTLLREFCGAGYESMRSELLDSLSRPDHRSLARVHAAIGIL